ncbi:hypothetical protein SAMD00024442_127_3 [Candidatus Symbiothrix dinenymphae]|nr:hypothetical protein SAMD00024442_127_3 [Candidatus Symbiothrix dinenymphae]
MSSKTFNIYCDESTHLEHDGQPYMVYGYVSIAYNQIKLAKSHINQIKKNHGYDGELKWTNISDKTYPLYKEIVDYFFMTDLNFRAVIVDKTQIDNSRPDYTFNDFYFRMYFQLLHHKIDMENTYNVYFDIKDTCSQAKLHQLKDILKWNATVRNFQFIRSHESCFLQLADVLMGAVNYHLRIEKGVLEGKNAAKRKIVEIIQAHTNLSLNQTTLKQAKKFNLFFISLK